MFWPVKSGLAVGVQTKIWQSLAAMVRSKRGETRRTKPELFSSLLTLNVGLPMSLDFSLEGQVWGQHSCICILSPVNPMGPIAGPVLNQDYLPQRKAKDLLLNPHQKWLSGLSCPPLHWLCPHSHTSTLLQQPLVFPRCCPIFPYHSCQSDISRHRWLYPSLT